MVRMAEGVRLTASVRAVSETAQGLILAGAKADAKATPMVERLRLCQFCVTCRSLKAVVVGGHVVPTAGDTPFVLPFPSSPLPSFQGEGEDFEGGHGGRADFGWRRYNQAGGDCERHFREIVRD